MAIPAQATGPPKPSVLSATYTKCKLSFIQLLLNPCMSLAPIVQTKKFRNRIICFVKKHLLWKFATSSFH